jgi:hypothetical protein
MQKILFILLLCPWALQAQDSLQVKTPVPVVGLKFSPFSLIDPLTSIQFAVEYQVAQKNSLQHELGYITQLLYTDELGYRKSSGVRFRNEFRIYLEEKGSNLRGFYLAPELLLIYFRYERNAVYGQDCTGPFNCAYYQRKDYTVQKQVVALHQKVGYQSITNRFLVDIYTGIGYRHVRVRNIDEGPNNEGYYNFIGIRKEEGVYGLPSLSFGFKIGYLLAGKRERPSWGRHF